MGIGSEIGVVVLAGNVKVKKQRRRSKRRDLFHRIIRPNLWFVDRSVLEARLASRINRDDYIVGENKTLLCLHPDLISQKNLNYMKRVLYFAGKTGDRVYRKKKKDLLDFLSKEGRSPLSLVLDALGDYARIDNDMVVVVGPKRELRRQVHTSSNLEPHIVEQGSSVGENLLKGKRELIRRGYRGEYILVIGADIPLVGPSILDHFISSAQSRGERPDIYYGMGSREILRGYIRDQGLEDMGRVGPNYPRKGNMNKFGIPIVDDVGLFGGQDKRTHFMMGNMFLYRTSSVDRGFINKFYSLRKMAANPFTYPTLIKEFFIPLYRAARWRMPLTEAERTMKDKTGIEIKVASVPPEAVLDLDSYSDLRRLSALYFHKQRIDRDLEFDLKEYLKMKKRERKRRIRGREGTGSRTDGKVQ